MAFDAPIAEAIWDMKYRLKRPDGTPLDATLEASWARVAKALAAPEAADIRDVWEARFRDAMADFRFLPAGRILAGAGAERNVTLFNCFVMGAVPDDMGGIFSHLREAALTMQQGGGVGYDFSTLRPKGAAVAGVGADASGPLSFMDVWDAMCRTIMSAGSRRGAMMAVMRCDHPDIEDFIDAKRDAARLRMFNLSVAVTDAFMAAREADADWPLTFNGETYKTAPARALWERIMRATYDVAEPGVLFIDRINVRNNLAYCETISATNPCVTGDAWVLTTSGPRQARELVGRACHVVVNGAPQATDARGFFATGRKPVLRLKTDRGFELRLTRDHPVLTVRERTRFRRETAWRKAGDVSPGVEIVLADHSVAPAWGDPSNADDGYLIGLLIGDGVIKADKTVLSVWKRSAAVNGDDVDGVEDVMARAEAAMRRMPHRADFAGWMSVAGRDEHRMTSAALRRLAEGLGLAPGRKTITPEIERRSAAFHCGFLEGLFDADGSVQGDQKKGVSVRLAQSDRELLEAAQRMLARLGVISTIYYDRRPRSRARLPDGRGGAAFYETRAQHELIISGDNLQRYAERIGFTHGEKAARLRALLTTYRRAPNRERFTATIVEIEEDGEEDVFDVAVPGVNAFDANGLIVHNCGEQPLPPYGACLLGSINLARLVERPFEAGAALDEAALKALTATAVRAMDNVIDISRFALAEQAAEAQAKRRIGLGVTGLGDALIMCGARYGGAEAVALTERWLAQLRRAAYLASADLAAEKGAFPLFDAAKFLAGETAQSLDEDVRAAILEKGLRNGLLTSIAPTGTISLYAGNVSSGVEPVFAWSYKRRVLEPDGTAREETVADYAYAKFREKFGPEAVPSDAFVDAQTLKPEDHLAIQAAAQKYVDSAISKTINCPADMDFEAFEDVYLKAYETGCKGCATYRPNSVTGAVLTAEGGSAPSAEGHVVRLTEPLERPDAVAGRTYKIKWPESDHAIYVTINDIALEGRARPFEIFINSKNMEHYAWTVALTRMISAVFRRGGDVAFVVEELKAVFDPRGGQWMGGRYVPSLLAAIGGVIERHMVETGFIPRPEHALFGEPRRSPDAAAAMRAVAPDDRPAAAGCPRCGERALIRAEGCDMCLACGYSKCA